MEKKSSNKYLCTEPTCLVIFYDEELILEHSKETGHGYIVVDDSGKKF